MPSPRPNLQTYLDAHPHDPPRAVEAYRAARPEGSRALLDCVAACSSLDAEAR